MSRSSSRPAVGPTKSTKKAATTSGMKSAIATMMARSFAYTDRRGPTRERRSLIVIAREAVSSAPDGLDEHRASRVVAELVAKPAHEDIDGPIEGLEVEPSGLVQDAIPRQDAAAVAREEREELELRRGEVQEPPPEARGSARQVQLEGAGP